MVPVNCSVVPSFVWGAVCVKLSFYAFSPFCSLVSLTYEADIYKYRLQLAGRLEADIYKYRLQLARMKPIFINIAFNSLV